MTVRQRPGGREQLRRGGGHEQLLVDLELGAQPAQDLAVDLADAALGDAEDLAALQADELVARLGQVAIPAAQRARAGLRRSRRNRLATVRRSSPGTRENPDRG
ncbi:MAG TPA: hypothetical protein VHW96_13505 [Solirubrobacteraceae bacterium]|jgi:hypothetical protein|nr:hypothetical protein [Solirubrobacteraceae bacterium]